MKLFKNLFALAVFSTSTFVFAEMPTLGKNTATLPEMGKQAVTSVKESANIAVTEKMAEVKQAVKSPLEKSGKQAVTSVKASTSQVAEKASAVKATAKKATKVNVNTADVKTLQTLNGIGESKAKAIIDYRNKNGKIKNINELAKVSGIGEATLEKLKGFIAF